MNIENFWLKQSNLLEWKQKPSFAYKKKNNNYIDWYPDGKTNIFDNCITRNIKIGLGKKVAIHCIDRNKKVQSYTYEQINEKVNSFSIILSSHLKNKKISPLSYFGGDRYDVTIFEARDQLGGNAQASDTHLTPI